MSSLRRGSRSRSRAINFFHGLVKPDSHRFVGDTEGERRRRIALGIIDRHQLQAARDRRSLSRCRLDRLTSATFSRESAISTGARP